MRRRARRTIGRRGGGRLQIALVPALALSLTLPWIARSQGLPPSQNVTNPAQLPLLATRSGCWQITFHTKYVGVVVRNKEEILAQMTPQQRAAMRAQPGGAQMLDGIVQQIRDAERHNKDQAERGAETAMVSCPPTPDQWRAVEAPGFASPACSRTIQASDRALRIRAVCPGIPPTRAESDVELTDPQHLTGTYRLTPDPSKPLVQLMEIRGKWLSDAAPHMPSGVTDVNGRKPVGPGPIAGLDPYRIVAIIDGKPLVAGFAWRLATSVPPPERRAYDSRLAELVQKVYSELAVGNEAVKLGIVLQEPWRTKLRRLGFDEQHDFGAATDYPGSPNVPLSLLGQYNDIFHHILYDAYLSQAATDAERQALLRRIDRKYKIKVIDRDFFNDGSGS